MAPLAEALATASSLVARVASGRSLAAGNLRDSARDQDARAAVADLCYGTLRRYGRSQATVNILSHRKRAADRVIESLLWCAFYALETGRYSDYAVVDQAVHACSLLRRAKAGAYVNALLRTYLRSRGRIEARLGQDVEARYQHPAWWIEKVRAAYPSEWESVLAAGNSHPPMCLRINRRRSTPEAYLHLLEASAIAAQLLPEGGLLLTKPVSVERIPGFADGLVSVQDAGAQRAATFLDLRAGQRVLDACAAPGGKTAHILELADVALTALDIDELRCADIRRNLARLGLEAEVRQADCCALDSWWDGRPFDRILADVPCSSSGVVRRHPDIKWLRRDDDIPAFAARQSRILDALWRTLAPGGKLLYVTCSVFPEENSKVVDAFVARTPGAARAGLADGACPVVLPSDRNDGFFLALLARSD